MRLQYTKRRGTRPQSEHGSRGHYGELHDRENHRDHQQNMDEPTQRVGRDHSKQPKHQEYHEDRPQHLALLDPMNALGPVPRIHANWAGAASS
jgi:hypothetical protein